MTVYDDVIAHRTPREALPVLFIFFSTSCDGYPLRLSLLRYCGVWQLVIDSELRLCALQHERCQHFGVVRCCLVSRCRSEISCG